MSLGVLRSGFLHACANKTLEKRVRLVGFTLEFGMKLAGDIESMVFDFHHFNKVVVLRAAADNQACRFEGLPILAVEFETVPVAFAHLILSIETSRKCIGFDVANLSAQPHGAPLVSDIFLCLH